MLLSQEGEARHVRLVRIVDVDNDRQRQEVEDRFHLATSLSDCPGTGNRERRNLAQALQSGTSLPKIS